MARRKADADDLYERRYRHDLARWAEWRQQQDRLRALVPRAIDVLEEELEAGGPDAVKLALALVRLANVADAPTKPDRLLLSLADADELRAGLPPDEPAALPAGDT